MVCPYCSIDMEPIELNGKVFCSNCGLTIKTLPEPTRLNPSANITSGYKTSEPVDEVSNSFPAFPEETPAPTIANMNPLTDGTREELGIPVSISEADSVIGPEMQSQIANSAESEIKPPEDLASDVLSVERERIPATESTDQLLSVKAQSETNENQYSVTGNDIDDIIKTLSQSELSSHKPLPTSINTDQIKEIDSLAAGGILLDILGDNLTEKEDEAEIKVLEAAKTLVKNIKPAEINTKEGSDNDAKDPKAQPKQPEIEAEQELNTEIVTEIEELESKIKNAPENSFEISEKDIKKYDPDAIDMSHLKIGHKTSRISPSNQANIRDTIKTAILPGAIQPSPVPDTKDIPEEAKPAPVQEDKNPVKTLLSQDNEPKTGILDNTPKDLNTIAESNKKTPNKVSFFSNFLKSDKKKIKKQTASTPKEHASKTKNNAAHISPDYFKKVIRANKTPITANQAKGLNGPKKSKQKHLDKMSTIYILLGLIGLFLVVAAIFLLKENMKPESQNERALSAATFNTKRPSYIPEGYILSSAKFDKDKNIYTLNYVFTTDKERQVVFTQTRQAEPIEYIDKIVKNDYKDKEFSQKTLSEQDYTEIEQYTIIWNRAEMVYTISATNTIMDNNLLYKMAESIK